MEVVSGQAIFLKRNKKANLRFSQVGFLWRRRESNESPDQGQGDSPQEVTNATHAVGVSQEYLPFTGGRQVTFTDARLVSIVKRWADLPEELRNKVEALSLQPVS